ncbi:uncharacterized protein LOC111716532, partial [Eurytemora carolleeae]|uniref:uncharacterized protein LOC111716532 n=1 Tax=Eurytemora carolleeae TaxID=1294199 RepID=UPI000C762D89
MGPTVFSLKMRAKKKKSMPKPFFKEAMKYFKVIVVTICIAITCWQGYSSTEKYIAEPKIMHETIKPTKDGAPDLRLSVCKKMKVGDCSAIVDIFATYEYYTEDDECEWKWEFNVIPSYSPDGDSFIE